MSLLTANEFNGYLNGHREVFTQLGLKYRQRLIQGIKSDEMLKDLFTFSAMMRVLRKYDTADLPGTEATANPLSPTQIEYVIDAANCIRVKYNIDINFANYITAADASQVPLLAILMENGDPILMEDGDYILMES